MNTIPADSVELTPGARAALLKRAQGGDTEAFAALFEALRPSVYAVAIRLVGPDDVDDVVMDTYLKAWQALPRFRGGAQLKTWLYRIAYNCGIDTLRRRDRRKEDLLSEVETERGAMPDLPDERRPAPDEEAVLNEGAEAIRRALEQLPADHRRTLTLRFAEGFSCAEIAAATGVSLGTVLSRIFYGKRKLRRLLREQRE